MDLSGAPRRGFPNQRNLVSYAGYDLVENQSGTRSGKTRISKQGNHRIRRVLHLPAFNRWYCREKQVLRLDSLNIFDLQVGQLGLD
jgi:transposase